MTKDVRSTAFAKTFQALGHLVHLDQDAASPAHTRNDPHVLFNYESFVSAVQFSLFPADQTFFQGLLDQAWTPDPAWMSAPANQLAPVPIARLLDTDLYNGSNPNATMGSFIGLSEYANANFFSEDTVFQDGSLFSVLRIPFPARSSVVEQSYSITLKNGRPAERRYYRKIGDGDSGYRLATVGFLQDYIQRFNLNPSLLRTKEGLDESVYRDYAERLVPRAVGYSAALLDYFFRGDVWASGDNLSMGLLSFGNEAMQGSAALYYDDEDDVRHPVPGAVWSVALRPSEILTDLRFPPPTDPRPKVPDKYMLVFRGTLGGEAGAVAGAEVFIESVVVVHLVKRKNGAPLTNVLVKTIDVETEETVGSGFTGSDGKVRVRWRPGRSAVFIKNRFPIYWAGEGGFASELEDARIVQAQDTDSNGVLRIAIPVIDGDVPVQTSACTGFPQLGFPPRLYNDSFFVDPEHIETRTGVNRVRGAMFTRGDSGEATVICAEEGGCIDLDSAFLAEDLNRVGQVIGTLEWDASSTQQTVIYPLAEDGSIDDAQPVYICTENVEGIQTGAVTLVER